MPKRKKTSKKRKLSTYADHRDHFFETHPRARLLLGAFIVSVAFMIGMMYRELRIHEEVAKYLWNIEEIEYNPNL